MLTKEERSRQLRAAVLREAGVKNVDGDSSDTMSIRAKKEFFNSKPENLIESIRRQNEGLKEARK